MRLVPIGVQSRRDTKYSKESVINLVQIFIFSTMYHVVPVMVIMNNKIGTISLSDAKSLVTGSIK